MISEKEFFALMELHRDSNNLLAEYFKRNTQLYESMESMREQAEKYEAEIAVLEKRIKELERSLESATGKLKIIHSMTDQLESS